MPWLAGSIVLAVFFGTLAAARALEASPYNVAGGLVMTTATLAWVGIIVAGTDVPHQFREPFGIYSSAACVVACVFAFTRRLIWPILPLLYFGQLLLFTWALKNGPPRMF